MQLNIPRAIGYGVLAYIGSFLIGMLTTVLFQVDFSSGIPHQVWFAGAIASIIIVALAAWGYFRKNAPKPSVNSGAQFGLVAVVIGFVLDTVVLSPMIIQTGSATELIKYYSDYRFWITLALVVASATGTGAWLEKNKKR